MSTWPNAIATNPADLATPEPATPWVDSFCQAARVCRAFRTDWLAATYEPGPF
jgi:hypothetical protein